MNAGPWVLAVDGGNTKTLAVVASLDGTVCSTGRSGCGDIYGASSASAALDAIEEAVTQAAQGVSGSDIAAAVCSLAGADWPEDHELYHDNLIRRLGIRREALTVFNDGLGPLRLGSPTGTGVSIVLGTGCAIGARGTGGQTWHGSFWIERGGSADLGYMGLRAVYRSAIGLGAKSSLIHSLLALYDASSVEDLLHRFTRREGGLQDVAALAAPMVLEAADAGDAVAVSALRKYVEGVADSAYAVAQRVGLGPGGFPDTSTGEFPVVFAGGLLQSGLPAIEHFLGQAVLARLPQARPVLPSLPPVAGVLLEACSAAGARLDEGLVANLAKGLSPSSPISGDPVVL